MILENINNANRNEITQFIKKHWFTSQMILRGEIIDMTKVEGIIALEENEIIALLSYRILGDSLEILSLDSLLENRGIGTELINTVIQIAKSENCKRIILITTNDNINAMRFYQKRGFDMIRIYRNALDVSRKLKPEIPLFGENGIPLKHEIEFELLL